MRGRKPFGSLISRERLAETDYWFASYVGHVELQHGDDYRTVKKYRPPGLGTVKSPPPSLLLALAIPMARDAAEDAAKRGETLA